MSHESARKLLERAGTPAERTDAVRAAVLEGMPLHEIEEYLDWLDMQRAERVKQAERNAKQERSKKKRSEKKRREKKRPEKELRQRDVEPQVADSRGGQVEHVEDVDLQTEPNLSVEN